MKRLNINKAVVVGTELALAWEDGLEQYLDFEMLRKHCPCASCQGEPDARGRLVKPEVEYAANSFQLLGYEEVGGYAMRLRWADGHGTGLYSYDLLRSLEGI